MSGLFRSESMVYARLVMSEEVAYDTIKELGEFGKAQIVDLAARHGHAAPSERVQYFKKRVAQAAYFERKFQNFDVLFRQYNIEQPSIDLPAIDIGGGDILENVRTYLDPVESTITKNVLYAKEQRHILLAEQEKMLVLQSVGKSVGISHVDKKEYGTFTTGEASSLLAPAGEAELLSFEDDAVDEEKAVAFPHQMGPGGRRIHIHQTFMNSIHGVIPDDKAPFFERMIFRVSRGNVVTRITPITAVLENPDQPGTYLKKSVFSLTFVGDQLAKRLRKIITYFGGLEYEVPQDEKTSQRYVQQLMSRINDARQMLKVTEREVHNNLLAVAYDEETRSSPYLNYLYALKVEKAICDAMKQCEVEREGSSMLKLEAWVPAEDADTLKQALKRATSRTGAQPAACDIFQPEEVARLSSPPTYFKTNAFTSGYQGIVDTYGSPRYKEVNPGLFTIISFPFLFGVMYGDIGHGSLLFLGALYFILREEHYEREVRYGRMDEILGMVFGGRYLLILMGAFAVYAGFIYNDFFSVPTNIFGTRWTFPSNEPDVAAVSDGSVYPFGVDPSWYHTTNELAFFNSMKMKLAVTLGVVQMTFGICLSALNHVYFHDRAAFVFEFIPRLTFMLCTFGYMIFIIVLKLSIDWTKSSVSPPNLVQTMIAMFLSPGNVDPDKQLYAGQAAVQTILLLLALISVPIMLLAQPLIARAEHNRIFGPKGGEKHSPAAGGYHQVSIQHDPEHPGHLPVPSASPEVPSASPAATGGKEVAHVEHEESGGHGPNPRSPHYNFSDHCIVSGIHTIEFVLGAVSNTASYLRLWALSLAHAELSSVFWNKMIQQYGLNGDSPLVLALGFAVWFTATFAVLLAMDVLECFLHALRLHWVEFQNKFYAADGYPYHPFSFATAVVSE